MRHFYFRLLFGFIWLAAAVFSALCVNLPFAALYVVMGVRFLRSAYRVWKKERPADKRR